jgi:hypothetical protein
MFTLIPLDLKVAGTSLPFPRRFVAAQVWSQHGLTGRSLSGRSRTMRRSSPDRPQIALA